MEAGGSFWVDGPGGGKGGDGNRDAASGSRFTVNFPKGSSAKTLQVCFGERNATARLTVP
jgi:hypothetical protein